ncbi:MFS transporter [Streptomyces sp. HNM0574]|uniref:MFS transporter n=1 Tax=Streptomyces sp. HNM0574 TaxID=2714954 RepID=UPI00146A7A52|nr:MFS transporter [Streptomyces sp. HNM0574]NLU68543.1 MFS transporter [Streptomyces sp. HNM0574]
MAEQPPPRAGRREWLGLAVLALPTLLLALSMTSLNLAIPHLSADLKPSGTQLLWIIDIYGFLIAGTLITMGSLGDRFGRRRLLMIGSVTFAAASVVGAFSTSPEMLIVMRALLGLSGSTLMPSTLALLSTMFRDKAQRTFAISTWMATFMGGTAVGPLAGGALLEYFWWGSVFLMGAPVMLLLVLLGPLLLPESKTEDSGRIDVISVLLSLAGILTMVYGLKKGAEQGLEVVPFVFMGVGAVICLVFLRRQRRLTHPLLDLDIFKERSYSTPIAAVAMAMIMNGGINFFLMQFLQMIVGLSPLQAGLCTLPPTAVSMASSMLGPKITKGIRPGYVLACSFLITAGGFAVVAQADRNSGVVLVVSGLVVMAVGFGTAMALSTSLALGSISTEKSGVASATSETSTELGMSLGIAFLGSLGTAVYRNQINALAPDGVPEASLARAEDTIGAAMTEVERLSGQAADGLLDAASTAFATGLRVNSIVGAAGMALVAVVVAVLLRKVPPIADDPDDADKADDAEQPDGGDGDGAAENSGQPEDAESRGERQPEATMRGTE